MSGRAEKLYQQMRDSKASCTLDDLYALYAGFGFEMRRGKKHDIIKHPRYKWLRAALPRKHSNIALGYFDHAVNVIDELKKLESGGKDNE
jgi:hypothetical protein